MPGPLRLPLLAFALAAGAFGAPASAEEFANSAGDKGLSFALPAGGAPTFGATYFLTSNTALRLDVGINLQLANAKPTGGADLAFSVEVAYRIYLARVAGGRVHPFLQPGVFFNRTGGGAATGTLAFEGSFGVELFLLEHFSIAGATGLALAMGNLGGTGGASIGVTTGTSALYASIYF